MRRVVALSPALLVLTLLSGCAVPAHVWRPYPSAEEASIAPIGDVHGQKFPDITFRDPDGNPRKLSDYRGKVVFLNFWAAWCPPCREEWPAIEKLYQALRGEPDIVFVLLNSKEEFSVGQSWARSMSYTVPLSRSDELTHAKIVGNPMPIAGGGTWAQRYIPETFVIDRNGVVIARERSNPVWHQYVEALRDLIRTSAPSSSEPRRAPSRVSHRAPGVTIDADLSCSAGERCSLSLRILPEADVRIPTGPGITLSSLTPSIRWLSPMPVTVRSEGEYFKAPPEFTVAFARSAVSVVTVRVDYAYCPNPSTCIIADSAVEVPIR
jgi:peroxiredoxin